MDSYIKQQIACQYNDLLLSRLELLDAGTLYRVLGTTTQSLKQLEILLEVDSTSNYLLNKKEEAGPYAVLAEQQTAGRGRFNRQWVSPFGRNIYLSLLWPHSKGSDSLFGLSLVVGIAVVRALEDYGLKQIGLKWPNDIFHAEKKLGGILIDITGNIAGPCQAIIGIGLNTHPTLPYPLGVNPAWTDIYSITSENPKRNLLAGLLLRHLLLTLTEFQQTGFKPFIKIWHLLDKLMDQAVMVTTPTGNLEGIACGIDELGKLRVNLEGKIHSFSSGEVSVCTLNPG